MASDAVEFADVVVNEGFTITSGTSSDLIDLHGTTLCGIFIPSSVASSAMTIFGSSSTADTTGSALTDGIASSDAKSYNIAASRYLRLDPADTAGLRYVRFVFSNSETSKAYELALRPVG